MRLGIAWGNNRHISGSMFIGWWGEGGMGSIDGHHLSYRFYENWWENPVLASQTIWTAIA